MLLYVYPSCLCNVFAATRPKCAPGKENYGLSGGRFTQQVTIASFGSLAAYIAVTAALVRYAKDNEGLITTTQRVGQTCKDLRHSEYAHGRYISSEMP